jgi:Rieske Fe-S protein
MRCTVVWRPSTPGYFCPCHRGHYGRDDGEPLLRDDLPPPDYPAGRPLDTLTVVIKGGRVLVRAGRGAEHRRKFGQPPPVARF